MGRKNKSRAHPSEASNDSSGLPKMQAKNKKKLNDLVNTLYEMCSTMYVDWEQFVRIQETLKKIEELEKDYVLPKLNREQNFESFLTWSSEHGALLKNVEICKFEEDGFGYKVKDTLEEGDIWLTVPRKLMMTKDSALASSIGSLIAKDKILSHMNNISLALHLLNERCDKNSFWSPYIKILPDEYDTTLYDTVDELQLLKGSTALDDAVKLCQNVARQYAYFYKLLKIADNEVKNLPLKTNFTYDNYRWAVSTVMTRQNSVPSADGSSQQLALIPMWDMCNHSNGKLSTDYNLEKKQLESYTFRKFEADEQLFMFYGSRCNADLLLHNGFVYEENQFDSVAIKLELRKSDPLYSKKEEILLQLGIPVSGSFYVYNGSSPVEGAILTFHRIAVMNEEMLEKYCKNPEQLDQLSEVHCCVDEKVDQLCWRLIDMRLKHVLQNYATIIQEDDELLASGKLSRRASLAVNLRRCEKRILQSAIDFISARDCGRKDAE